MWKRKVARDGGKKEHKKKHFKWRVNPPYWREKLPKTTNFAAKFFFLFLFSQKRSKGRTTTTNHNIMLFLHHFKLKKNHH